MVVVTEQPPSDEYGSKTQSGNETIIIRSISSRKSGTVGRSSRAKSKPTVRSSSVNLTEDNADKLGLGLISKKS